MSTVIRIKRRCDEQPQDAIVVNCKKHKREEAAEGNRPTVLQFAGTVDNQEVDVLKHCKSSKHLAVEAQVRRKGPATTHRSLRERIREDCIAQSKAHRYKVVNLHRSNVQDAQILPEKQQQEVTIVDVESQANVESTVGSVTETSAASSAERLSLKYVYDLYYTTSDDLGDLDQQLVGFVATWTRSGARPSTTQTFLITSRVYPLSSELVCGSQRDNGYAYADSEGEQSDDSNDENNWRNDYPDEDDNHHDDDDSIRESDMLTAMRNVHLDNELSSDDEAEGFVYSIDSEAAGFEEDIDDSDVNRYGERYARFKAKYLKNCSDSCVEEGGVSSSSLSSYEEAEDRELDDSSTYYD